MWATKTENNFIFCFYITNPSNFSDDLYSYNLSSGVLLLCCLSVLDDIYSYLLSSNFKSYDLSLGDLYLFRFKDKQKFLYHDNHDIFFHNH